MTSRPHEIGLAADGLAHPRAVSSQTSGAVLHGNAQDGAGSFLGRQCEFCRTALKRKRGEQLSKYEERRFCGHSCSSLARVAKLRASQAESGVKPHHCKECRTQLVRKDHEHLSNFNARKFCNPECSRVFFMKAKRMDSQAIASDLGFPKPVDRYRISEVYGSERYDAPGRIVLLAPARRMSPIYGTHVYQESTAAMASG